MDYIIEGCRIQSEKHRTAGRYKEAYNRVSEKETVVCWLYFGLGGWYNKTETECETDFERWIFVLNNMETLNRMPFKAQKAVFEKLEEIVDVHSLSEEDRVRYENSVNAYRDYLATIDYAAKKGSEEGFEEGFEKGRREEKFEMARNLKAMGMTSEQIMNITHLSLAEIESLS